jgi:beta-aspartyl-dipeptidase (metallo-type)
VLTLIAGGEVWAPEPLGRRDLLIAGRSIAAVATGGSVRVSGLDLDVIDAAGMSVVPGLIDPHVHILGGGGEGGPATRAPEIKIEDIVASGVTGLIGCLGTDGITRHMTSLLAKARALEIEGISAWVYSGSYEVPVKTLTGSVRSDLVLIDKVVGAGEIAISDHRSAQPTFEEIARLAAECRVGGMLGGKAGILHLHLGDGPRGLEFLRRLAAETEIPRTQVVPTHCNRNPRLLDEAIEWAAAGGCVDLTAGLAAHDGGVAITEAIRLLLARGAPLDRVTISSDANGSIPVFGPDGQLTAMGVASQRELFADFRALVEQQVIDLVGACRLFATNAAAVYKLARKGKVAVGQDADVLVLGPKLELREAFAMGRRVVAAGVPTVRSTFAREASHG